MLDVAFRSIAVLMLGHGAGGGIEAPDLRAVRDALVPAGVAVARVVQPYRVAGRRARDRAEHLDAAWLDAARAVRELPGLADVPLVVGGRSSGARVACRTAAAAGAAGVLALAFPLRPPGRPAVSRLDELLAVGRPTLVVQGTRDAFGGAEALAGALADAAGGAPDWLRLVAAADADHAFAVPRASARSRADCLAEVAAAAREFVLGLAG